MQFVSRIITIILHYVFDTSAIVDKSVEGIADFLEFSPSPLAPVLHFHKAWATISVRNSYYDSSLALRS